MTIAVALPAEAQDFLAAHPDTQFVDIIFTGLSGTARGKRIRVHELAALYGAGRPLPVSTGAAVTGSVSSCTQNQAPGPSSRLPASMWPP